MSLDRRITKSRVAQLSISAVPNICANQQHEKTRKVYKIIKFYVRTQICISFCKPNCYNFNSGFCEIILRFLVSRICTTSQLILGNLSRHCTKGSNNKRTYQNYSNMFENLASKKIKTICSNNRTQKIIKQHFYILKSIFFKENCLTSLDEFAQNFSRVNDVTATICRLSSAQ